MPSRPEIIPPDRMKVLERLHERLTQEYRECLATQSELSSKLRETEQELDTVAMALDWARRLP